MTKRQAMSEGEQALIDARSVAMSHHPHDVTVTYAHAWDGYEWRCPVCGDAGSVKLKDIVQHRKEHKAKRRWWHLA